MSQKILVVDDEPGIVAVIQSYFKHLCPNLRNS